MSAARAVKTPLFRYIEPSDRDLLTGWLFLEPQLGKKKSIIAKELSRLHGRQSSVRLRQVQADTKADTVRSERLKHRKFSEQEKVDFARPKGRGMKS
jgi:hypothetical protein